eukprot:NODE_41_length_3200_cov_120.503742_g39_i0.p1 GENE.NODE_41_length_3200_cov_120.503742_g39_i0~~NODE_41_length_3200_cov_120.503742_g39_i0.p1  ORF type:complete len:328 (+),score=69.75 NODE_41_length_3200_cov_120.503742_g39_i0:75-1058(+)
MSCNLFKEAVSLSDKHPKWHPPAGTPDGLGVTPGLKILNSLTETVEPFVPMDGRRVTWYTCGPTVYDSCHMGHARAYLTMDILRRIMEDYFGYEVYYQINITDIDDKIILRARQNKLFADYADAKPSEAQAREDAQKALDEALAKAQKKKADLEAQTGLTGKARDEQEEGLKGANLKLTQLAEAGTLLKAAKSVSDILAAAADPLKQWLDAAKGKDITDKEIFFSHARKYEREYMEDMTRLGVRDPDVLTRVTEYLPQIIAFIQKIIDNGHAYQAEDGVYFAIDNFRKEGHDYPKLKPGGGQATAEEMAESEVSSLHWACTRISTLS